MHHRHIATPDTHTGAPRGLPRRSALRSRSRPTPPSPPSTSHHSSPHALSSPLTHPPPIPPKPPPPEGGRVGGTVGVVHTTLCAVVHLTLAAVVHLALSTLDCRLLEVRRDRLAAAVNPSSAPIFGRCFIRRRSFFIFRPAEVPREKRRSHRAWRRSLSAGVRAARRCSRWRCMPVCARVGRLLLRRHACDQPSPAVLSLHRRSARVRRSCVWLVAMLSSGVERCGSALDLVAGREMWRCPLRCTRSHSAHLFPHRSRALARRHDAVPSSGDYNFVTQTKVADNRNDRRLAATGHRALPCRASVCTASSWR